MATYGVFGSPTYAVAINDLGLMLTVLPDNSSNLISAGDVRDIVAGLFENIESVSFSVTNIATSSISYTNLNPTSVLLGGIAFNTTFNNVTVQSIFDELFYPYTPPQLTLTVSPNVVEFGNTSQTVLVNFSIQAGINDVQDATLIRPADSNLTTIYPLAFGFTSSSVGSNNILPNQLSIFTFSVDDNIPPTGGITTVTASVDYSLSRFWGTLPVISPLVSVSTASFNESDCATLTKELNSDYSQSREIMTNNDYVVFVYPQNSVNLQYYPPKVFINGLPNNDWIKTRDGVIFTNVWGYTASYDVWRFNNIQGTFTSSYIITT
jgi:hypothetical protein